MNSIKVLIIDDSLAIQKIISIILNSDSGIEVIGVANDAYDARDKIKALHPDVITVDIEMPRMNGLDFIEKVMRLNPLPIVVCSSCSDANNEITKKALTLGAMSVVAKPSNASEFNDYSIKLIAKVKEAANQRVMRPHKKSIINKAYKNNSKTTEEVNLITIGASTGGIEAIRTIFKSLNLNCPPIIVTQHLPPKFTKSFANSLTKLTPIKTYEAEDKMLLQQGTAYIAPGDRHLEIVKSTSEKFKIRLSNAEPVSNHRPSIDVMFDSVANQNPKNSIGIILTGMGTDGANGLLHIKENGGITIAQDKETSIVWGMPNAAIQLNAAQYILDISDIGSTINDFMGVEV